MRLGACGTRLVRWAAMGGLLPITAFVALVLCSLTVDVPAGLSQVTPSGQRILDRDGLLIARTRARDGVFRAPVALSEAGKHFPLALLAAEDKRFYHHGGIDPGALLRALGQAVIRGRLVSGASTITQQLARTTFRRPRTLAGKWREMMLAFTIERALEKDEILEHYLNRVAFGPQIVGAGAAADHYFGKALSELSLSEAAALAGLVRGPTLYDPRVRPDLAQRRRDRVLVRMLDAGFISDADFSLAREARLELLPRPPLEGAKHWVRQVGRRTADPAVRTTLHRPLQREVESLVAERTARLEDRCVTAASVVVLDNQDGGILAWVGSPDFDDQRDGQNDGVVAGRQPGSTLKPFLYALGIEELGMTTASLLPDEPSHFRTAESFYQPRNFDRTYRGDVRLARALSNSLNVPAVHMISRLGIGHALLRLREMGFRSLDRGPEHYGPALALGDGEVTLLELASAYAMLARGGKTVAPRFLLEAPVEGTKQVLSPETCALISEVLSDDAARREAFGARSALELPFPVAVKTGTSKGYRDSWTIGYTRRVTVGVWVGNFDGSPTSRMTGARGAGPLFHQIMETVGRLAGGSDSPHAGSRPLHDVSLEQVPVCGEEEAPRIGTTCDPGQRSVTHWFSQAQLEGQGRERAGGAELGVSIARGPRATEPLLPEAGRSVAPGGSPRVAFPVDGMTFLFDPAVPPERQRLVLRSFPAGLETTLLVNGVPLPTERGKAEWILSRGHHQIVALSSEGRRSEAVEFFVR